MKRWIALLIPMLVLGAGCSGEEGLADGSVGVQESRVGLVNVNYEHSWADTHRSAQLTATAQFVRYSAMDREQVVRLLALPLDPSHDLPGSDVCQTYDLSIDLAEDAAMETEQQGYVELMEAGDLAVRAQGRTVTLLPRHFPGLLPFISGVVYGEAQTTLLSQETHQVDTSSFGGESVGAFAAKVQSPRLPALIQLAGQGPSNAVTLRNSDGLTLSWQPSIATAGKEVTYLELRYSLGKRDQVLRCKLQDDGSFKVPAAKLGQVRGRVNLALSRMRRTSFSAAGLEHAELRVSVQDTAILHIQ